MRSERQAQKRTDLAINYGHSIPGVPRMGTLQFFAQAQVINLFNQFQLCGCGGTVFQNGGATTQTRIDTTILTSVTTPAKYTPFNPFTTDAGPGRELGLRPDFRHSIESVRLYIAAAVPDQLRHSVLGRPVRSFATAEGGARKPRPFFFTRPLPPNFC